MQEEEICRAWIRSPGDPITRTVSCSSLSRDGEAFLRMDLPLSDGSARIRVLDANGDAVYDVSHESVIGEKRIQGASGDWTLLVDFEGAIGTGSIWLWG